MRALCTTSDELAVRKSLLRSDLEYTELRAAIIDDLFGVDSLDDATMLRMKLPKHQGVKLKKSKLASLAKKFFSIPSKYLSYYPNLTAQLKELEDRETLPGIAGSKSKRGIEDARRYVKRRRVGRPKKENKPISTVVNTPSILTFFSKRKDVN